MKYNPVMRKYIHIALGLLIFFTGVTSYADELKICEEGISKCNPLIKDSAKFSKCMRLMCFDYYSEKEKKTKDDSKYYFKYVGIEDNTNKKPDDGVEKAETCEYGLRKCDVLRDIPEYYWECMTDSCRNPSSSKPNCELGQNMCVDRQRIYNDCMKFTCGDPSADFESCPRARFSCNESLRSYWHCVYGVCLGSVDEYKRPPSNKKYMIIEDAKGKKRKIQVNKTDRVLKSAPGWMAIAPPGVDPEEWARDVPQKFFVQGNPSDYMRCMLPTSMLDCPQNDVRSCRCSDGSVPLMMNGVPSPSLND